MQIVRSIVILFLFLVVPSISNSGSEMDANGSAIGKKLIIGVRSHAAPFSFWIGPGADGSSKEAAKLKNGLVVKSGPLRAAGYDGYMVHICDEILLKMMVDEGNTPTIGHDDVGIFDIDTDGVDVLRLNEDRLTLLGEKFDILCDPATISRDRVRAYASSPPLFLSGIGYLQPEGAPGPRGDCEQKTALVGAVGTTNAINVGVNAILAAGEWRNLRSRILTGLRDLQNGEKGDETGKRRCSNEGYEGIIWQARTHREVAEKFCGDKEIFYYVGDVEIIQESIKRYAGCTASSSVQRFTSDRYAIFADMAYGKGDDDKARLIARFFEILNREVISWDSLLDQAYFATFGDRPHSQLLGTFFWSIRGGQ